MALHDVEIYAAGWTSMRGSSASSLESGIHVLGELFVAVTYGRIGGLMGGMFDQLRLMVHHRERL
jgi:hypothetical protein